MLYVPKWNVAKRCKKVTKHCKKVTKMNEKVTKMNEKVTENTTLQECYIYT